MPYYKKTTTHFKHDRARKEHLKEIELLRNEWNRTKNYEILKKLVLFENQLRIYDRIMEYDKISADYR